MCVYCVFNIHNTVLHKMWMKVNMQIHSLSQGGAYGTSEL